MDLKKEKQQILNDLGYLETAMYMKWVYTGSEMIKVKELDTQILDYRSKRNALNEKNINYDQVNFQ